MLCHDMIPWCFVRFWLHYMCDIRGGGGLGSVTVLRLLTASPFTYVKEKASETRRGGWGPRPLSSQVFRFVLASSSLAILSGVQRSTFFVKAFGFVTQSSSPSTEERLRNEPKKRWMRFKLCLNVKYSK